MPWARRKPESCGHAYQPLIVNLRTEDISNGERLSGHSGPFHRYEHVLSQQTRSGIIEVLRAFRSTIGSVMKRHRIRLPPTDQDRFAIQSTIEFIDADIVELGPEYMGGYGELDEGARAELLAIVDEFSGHLSAHRLGPAAGPARTSCQRGA